MLIFGVLFRTRCIWGQIHTIWGKNAGFRGKIKIDFRAKTLNLGQKLFPPRLFEMKALLSSQLPFSALKSVAVLLSEYKSVECNWIRKEANKECGLALGNLRAFSRWSSRESASTLCFLMCVCVRTLRFQLFVVFIYIEIGWTWTCSTHLGNGLD